MTEHEIQMSETAQAWVNGTRGVCPVCKLKPQIARDGTLVAHRAEWPPIACEGEGQEPESVIIPTSKGSLWKALGVIALMIAAVVTFILWPDGPTPQQVQAAKNCKDWGAAAPSPNAADTAMGTTDTTVLTAMRATCPDVVQKYQSTADSLYATSATSSDAPTDTTTPRLSDTWAPTGLQSRQFLSDLHDLNSLFESENDDQLIQLGVQVCESLHNGDSQADVTTFLHGLSSWSLQQSSQFVAADKVDMCPLN